MNKENPQGKPILTILYQIINKTMTPDREKSTKKTLLNVKIAKSLHDWYIFGSVPYLNVKLKREKWLDGGRLLLPKSVH